MATEAEETREEILLSGATLVQAFREFIARCVITNGAIGRAEVGDLDEQVAQEIPAELERLSDVAATVRREADRLEILIATLQARWNRVRVDPSTSSSLVQ